MFVVVPLHFFGSKSAISRFGERFRDGQYSLVSFLFAVLLLTVPPVASICKSGGGTFPVPNGVGAGAGWTVGRSERRGTETNRYDTMLHLCIYTTYFNKTEKKLNSLTTNRMDRPGGKDVASTSCNVSTCIPFPCATSDHPTRATKIHR